MKILESPKEKPLMKEEIFATWIATSLILSVLGSQFTGRAGISNSLRVTLDVSTIGLSASILVWASASFFELIGHTMHKYILIGIMLSMLAIYIFVATQTFRFKL